MTKEDLKSYKKDVESSQTIIEHLEEIRANITKITAPINDMPHGGNNVKDKMAEQIAILEDEVQKALKREIYLQRKRNKILEQLSLLNGQYKMVLIEHYIKGKNLVTIAAEKNYHYDYIRHVNGIALNKFDELDICKIAIKKKKIKKRKIKKNKISTKKHCKAHRNYVINIIAYIINNICI